MAGKTKAASAKAWTVTVNKNKDFCGTGAGGTQFAHGAATITNERLAEWFREHAGYTVAEVKVEAPAE